MYPQNIKSDGADLKKTQIIFWTTKEKTSFEEGAGDMLHVY